MVDPTRALAGQLFAQRYLTRILLHDLGSPVGSILLYADTLLVRDLEPASKQRLARLRSAAVRAQALTDRLAEVTAQPTAQPQAVSLPDLLADAQAILETRLRAAGVSVQADLPPALPTLYADHPTALVLLTVLLAQAAGIDEAAAPGGQVTVAARHDAGTLRLRLTGPGVRQANPSEFSDAELAPAGLLFLGAQAAAASLGGELRLASGEDGQPGFVVDFPEEISR